MSLCHVDGQQGKTEFEIKVVGQFLVMAPLITAFTATDRNMRVLIKKKMKLNTVRDFVVHLRRE